MATFLLRDLGGNVVLDLTSNLSMYTETLSVVLPKGSSMDTIVRKLDTAENHPRWWAYVASGEVLSANSAVVESYSNGMGCAILTKAMAIEAKLGDKILNQMDDTSSYFSVHDKFHRTLILSGFCLLKIAKI
ncbi:hypothetical protein B4S16_05995, partial [Acinetobacter baumannii]